MSISLINSKGVYVFILELSYSIVINVSRFKWLLKPGIYLYFGSARGKTSTSLEKRLSRHLKKHKKVFWHIDNLTSHVDTKILSAFYTTNPKITECQALQEFVQSFQDAKITQNFGSSDCKSRCGGHLLFFKSSRSAFTDLTKYFQQRNWKYYKVDREFE